MVDQFWRGTFNVQYRDFSAARLQPGEERERAIRATGQHPFPGNLVYRLGRGHVRRSGVFFRLTESA
jgi:hypothetical protein